MGKLSDLRHFEGPAEVDVEHVLEVLHRHLPTLSPVLGGQDADVVHQDVQS